MLREFSDRVENCYTAKGAKILALEKWQDIINNNNGRDNFLRCSYCNLYSFCKVCPMFDNQVKVGHCCIEYTKWNKEQTVENAQAVYDRIEGLEC